MRGPFYIYIHAPAFAPAPPHDARIFPEFLGVKRVFVSKFLRTYKDPSLVGWIGEFKRSLGRFNKSSKGWWFYIFQANFVRPCVLPSPWKSKGFYRRMNKAMLWSAWWNPRDFDEAWQGDDEMVIINLVSEFLRTN